jgi:hypothetical protein
MFADGTNLIGDTVQVGNGLSVSSRTRCGPAAGDTPIVVNVAGKLVRVSQSAVANAAFLAPSGRITFGRDAHCSAASARTGRTAPSTSRSSARRPEAFSGRPGEEAAGGQLGPVT